MDKMECEILGHVIGHATDWYMVDTMEIGFNNFEAAAGYNLPNGDPTFNFTKGTITYYRDDGTVNIEFDLINTLKHAS